MSHDMKGLGFATRQIHAGKKENTPGALCGPIYQTSTFEFNSVEQGGKRFAGKESGYIYTRLGNPTTGELEDKLANLEGGEACAATGSGMGAISSTMWSLLKAGDEVVSSDTLYGCTYALFTHGLSNFGVKVTFKDFGKLNEIKSALTNKTKVVYFETP
ncbi:MAG: PLP-dependent transferase, partial [archaeon]|nr:PLP-dependent transferase [archaeon]